MRPLLGLILVILIGSGGFYLFKHKKPQAVPLSETTRIRVIASFSILGDVIRNIGRDRVEVQTIVGPNEDAHIYRPTPQTVSLISQADLVVINGLGFEGWIERLISASGYKGPVIVASQGIEPKTLSDKEGKLLDDPHAWNSVENMIVYVKNITQALQAYDPIHADIYEKYSLYYIDQLRVLDAWIRQEVSRVPEKSRKVITAHDAFQYLGNPYGITFLAPVGITTEEEPSAQATAQLIDQIKFHNIHAVFIENISHTKLMETIAQEAGISIHGLLYSDALSTQDQPAPNYIAMMRHNITQLVKGML